MRDHRRVAFLDLGLLLGVLGALAASWVVFAGLGGASEQLSALGTTTTTPTSSSTTTTVATTTTTTTTTTPPEPTWPLTGLPAGPGDPIDSQAAAVKFDAHPSVRTYDGVERADIVFEELVEGGLTRFVGVFHSSVPELVGPVRSIRTSDFDLLANLGSPLVGFSGGNDLTVQALYATNLVPAPPTGWAKSFYHRSSTRRAPHDLELELAGLLAKSTMGTAATAPFERGAAGVAGIPVPSVEVPFSKLTTTSFSWDPGRAEWIRHDKRGSLVDADGRELGWTNVLILRTPYGRSPFDHRSPEVGSVGAGTALLLHGGQAVPLIWDRPEPGAGYSLTHVDGTPVKLPPGRTIIELEPAR